MGDQDLGSRQLRGATAIDVVICDQHDSSRSDLLLRATQAIRVGYTPPISRTQASSLTCRRTTT